MTTASTPTPLPAVLAFSALGNLASSVATVGVFFVAESAHGFTTAENYGLGLLMGATYAVAAWKAGTILRLLGRGGRGLSPRTVLAAMTAALAALCALPHAVPEKWAIYLFVGLYAPITGVFWSLVESFLSGGRRGEDLRRTIGRFNVTWSSAMALSMWLIAPHVAERPLEILLALAAVHAASLVVLVGFTREPARHADDDHRAPASYRALLSGHRVLLVASYLAMFALSPSLPELLRELKVPEPWRTPLGSAWMPARILVFGLMSTWHGWHGRRAVGALGAVLLGLGFGITVLSPALGSPASAIAAFVGGQVAFGVAVAALYSANLYYTLAVGDSSVEAGGSHEGLIGVGYTLGPLCGWAAAGLARAGALAPGHADLAMLGAVEALTLAAAVWAFRLARGNRRG